MLKLSNLELRRGTKILFQDVNVTIHPGQRVGITGANGAGKSSLFALILDDLHADHGQCDLPARWVIAYVAQEMPASDQPAIEYVLDGDKELRQIQRDMDTAEQAGHGERLAILHGQLDEVGGYRAPSRAATLLHGLGFTTQQTLAPVREFSGGWRMRLNLAQALMCRSDLLLLDEPTNHLDLDAVLWVEEWLTAYKGTLLLISHDREFLDNVINCTAHIEQQQLTLYTGNYSAFEVRRAEQLAVQNAAYHKQQREISHIKKFVDRFKAQATKARQAQSRLKALERMALIGPAHVDSPFNFRFFTPEKSPSPLLVLNGAAVGYRRQIILEQLSLSLMPGDRIGILGPNGAGKSTLVKLLAGELAALAGHRDAPPGLKIGYFAQHQIEQLDLECSPLLHLQRIDPSANEQSLRDFLGGFAFKGDVVLEPIAPLSGGEKARLVLAALVYQKPNLLLLDEPTNHLDLEMRHALTLALQDYAGALIVVSHDRYLLNSVSDQYWLVANNRWQLFDGDLQDYWHWLIRYQKNLGSFGPINQPKGSSNKQRRQSNAASRKRLQPLRKQATHLERQIDSLSREKIVIEKQLADESLYRSEHKALLKQALSEQASLKQRLDEAELKWLEIQGSIDEM